MIYATRIIKNLQLRAVTALMLLFAISLAWSADFTTTTLLPDTTQITFNHENDYPGYYENANGQMPDEGWSYFWITDEGIVSHSQVAKFIFHNIGSHEVTLVLTPRKRPETVGQVVFIDTINVTNTGTGLNGDYTNAPIGFHAEAKVGKQLYVILPLRGQCPKLDSYLYELTFDDMLLSNPTPMNTLPNLHFDPIIGGRITFDYSGTATAEQTLVVRFNVMGNDGDSAMFLYTISNPINVPCTEMEATALISIGPYDPNYKQADVAGINVDLDMAARQNQTLVEYTIHYQNIGRGPVDSITIEDKLPPHLTFFSPTGSSHAVTAFNYYPNQKKLVWKIGNMTNSRVNIRGTNQNGIVPINETQGWVKFSAYIDKEDTLQYNRNNSCYCLANKATIWFEDLDPIETEADVIPIGGKGCFLPDVNDSLNRKLYEIVCGNTSNHNGGKVSISKPKNEMNYLLVYPNPTTDVVKLKIPVLGVEKAVLIDAIGRQYFAEIKNHELDMSQLAEGFYLLKLEAEGTIYTSRIMKL
ncbi:MAG: T9SS type A sorting domain-containing protein [Flavobacteriales bacterium]|nr:T9SS type A sorting domain-containing protein [Flavobacteriales bacterium]